MYQWLVLRASPIKVDWGVPADLTYELTFNVRGPRYLGLTRSISWLLMPWLLTSPGHQQPWYWLCKIGRFLSYLGRISTTCVISMWRNDTKCKYMFMFTLKNLARKGLTLHVMAYSLTVGGGLFDGFSVKLKSQCSDFHFKKNMFENFFYKCQHFCSDHNVLKGTQKQSVFVGVSYYTDIHKGLWFLLN